MFEDLPEEWPAAETIDVDAMLITPARVIVGMPLGCRLVLLTREQVRVSVGMRKRATFNSDEWLVLVALAEDKRAMPDKMTEWLSKKAHSRNEFKIWLDKELELASDYQRDQQRRSFPTTVGETLRAWEMRLTTVLDEGGTEGDSAR